MEALLVFKKQNPYVMSTLGMIHADKFIASDRECVEISGIWCCGSTGLPLSHRL